MRVLLTALVVCTLCVSVGAVQPAAGGTGTATSISNDTDMIDDTIEGANETRTESAETGDRADVTGANASPDGDGRYESHEDSDVARSRADWDIEAINESIGDGPDEPHQSNRSGTTRSEMPPDAGGELSLYRPPLESALDTVAEDIGSESSTPLHGDYSFVENLGAGLVPDPSQIATVDESRARTEADNGSRRMASNGGNQVVERTVATRTSGNTERGNGSRIAADLRPDSTDEDHDGDDAGGPASGSDAGTGAALVVTVGCLGGSRVALRGAATLVSSGPKPALTVLRRVVDSHLRGLAVRIVPAILGYSRYDDSDALENGTRAEIYDLVRDSPGTYHAQIAAQTDVTEETVRYHSRVLADEGFVEVRKFRGRRRLYPVTMEAEAPEITAAIADSAAASVLEVIERQEPTTLSSVADTVGCAPSTAAHHLDRLEEDGLITRQRDGGSVRVSLRTDARSVVQSRIADD